MMMSIAFACMLSCFSRVWLCIPKDCSLPGSSVHGILQASILEWVAMPSSRGSSQPKDQKYLSCGPCTAGEFFLSLSHQGMSKSNYNSLKTVEYGFHIHNTLLAFRCTLKPMMQQREGRLTRDTWVPHEPEQVKSYEIEPPRKEN